MERFRGKVALVTGASAGIGRAIAKMLAENAMRVAVCARRAERLRELRAELPQADWLTVTADLRVESEIQALFARIREEWGGVDVLVNNAGLGHDAPLMSGDSAHWRETLELN